MLRAVLRRGCRVNATSFPPRSVFLTKPLAAVQTSKRHYAQAAEDMGTGVVGQRCNLNIPQSRH